MVDALRAGRVVARDVEDVIRLGGRRRRIVVLRCAPVGMTASLAMRQHEIKMTLVGDERDGMGVVAAMDPQRQQPREEG